MMNNKQEEQLQKLRKKISYIDEKIFKLILKRLNHALDIGKIKREMKSPLKTKSKNNKFIKRIQNLQKVFY